MKEINLFNNLLQQGVEQGASDLHLTSGAVPCYRVHGKLVNGDAESVSSDVIYALLKGIFNEYQFQEYQQKHTVDVGYSTPEGERFRMNVYQQLGQPAIAARHLDQRMLSLEELRLPLAVGALAELRSGLVLVTGATGSGKSTTLAALIDRINQSRASHILTVEDPVEFVHQAKKSLIHHRELNSDVPSFADAVKAALREDPDVILIGEMRDVETMRAALTAAETGHLVFSTLHTGDAVGSVERLVGSFPGGEQEVARHRIGMALRAVVAQHLVPVSDGGNRVPAVEILMINSAVANLIETGKSRQIFSVMETCSSEGMQTIDQALVKLVRDRLLKREDVLPFCRDPQNLDRLLGRPMSRAI